MSETLVGTIIGAVIAGGFAAVIAFFGYFRNRTHASAINDAKTAENDADMNKIEPKVDALGNQLTRLATSLDHVRGDIAKLTDVRERLRVVEKDIERVADVEIAELKRDLNHVKDQLRDNYVTQKEFSRIDERFKDLTEMLTKFMEKLPKTETE